MTPDAIRDRLNLSGDQLTLLNEYLYQRNQAYRAQVDRYRKKRAAANGEVERKMVEIAVRKQLSGEFAEQLARHALAPMAARVETQRSTYVAGEGRYTRTDLFLADLRIPVVLGRGKGLGAQVRGSLAVEVKCGMPSYLYAEKDHLVFQAKGHAQADARCTLCSRDIHDLPPDKESELREALRSSGSPLIAMMPSKVEIDRSILAFIRSGEERVRP